MQNSETVYREGTFQIAGTFLPTLGCSVLLEARGPCILEGKKKRKTWIRGIRKQRSIKIQNFLQNLRLK